MGFLDKKNINLVYDNELKDFLVKLGVYDDIISRNKKCKFTNEIISINNFYSVFMLGGEIKFVSDNPIAIKMFSDFLNNK